MPFQREISSDNLHSEMLPILEKHYHEIAAFHDIKLNPDFDKYKMLDESGGLRVYTARDEFHQLVGYAVFFVAHNPHYRDSLQATQDVIYIEKSQRGAGIGLKFIDWCDGELRKDGCQVVYHHVKQKHNFGPLLESLNYKLVDLIFARRLD